MCLAVVAVAAMLVVGRGSAMPTVEEAATAAAERMDDWPELASQKSELGKGYVICHCSEIIY
jgi:hypothetical protein